MDLRVLDLLVVFVAGLGAGLLVVALLDELESEEAAAPAAPPAATS